MNQRRTLMTGTLVLVAAVVVGFVVYSLLSSGGTSVLRGEISGYADQPTLGQDDAPVKLILFENFLCEHCKAFEEEVFPRLKEEYIDTGQVEAYYINLAWGGERSRLAGLAGECAYRQDERAFWEYKRSLYVAQDSWEGVGGLQNLADRIGGIDADELQTCVETARYDSEVERDLELADRVGVQATPSIVIGNQGFQGPSWATLQRAIEDALRGD